MNKKNQILKEESERIRELMGLKKIDENIISDLVDKIKNTDVYKKIEDFFDDEEQDDKTNSTKKKIDIEKSTKVELGSVPDHIIIGDSQTPYVDMNTSKASRISTTGGKSSLWLGGMGVPWLINALNDYPTIEKNVKTVVTVIGTNGNFGKVFNDNIPALFSSIREKFPNAKILVVQGSWGWGGLKNTTEEQVRNYYKKFKNQGGIIIEPPIGNVEPHSNLPIYEKIGKAIDSKI